MRWFLLFAVVFSGSALAQVQVHPAQLAPDQPFAIEIDAVFPNPCSLEGDWSLERQQDQLIVGLQPALVVCIEVISRLNQTIGPFRIDPGSVADGDVLEVVVVIDPDGTPQEIGRTTLTVSAEPPPADSLRPGLYWDPDLAGIGVAVSSSGEDVFLATFGFDAGGQPEWTIGQGRFRGEVLDDDLLGVTGGPCLRCGPAPSDSLQAAAVSPLQLIVTGPFAAVLTTGEQPDRGLLLQPFELRTIQSEGTIAGVTFEMPDLTGTWLFSDPEGGAAFRSDLLPRPTGIADSGMAWFESADGSVRLQCGGSAGVRFQCELFVDEMSFGSADARGISSHLIVSETLIGVRVSP